MVEGRGNRKERRFFHWELEFPDLYYDAQGNRRENPGFDCVLGNPPWDKVKPDRKEFYAHYDILIRSYKGKSLDARIKELQAVHPEAAPTESQYRAWAEEVSRFLTRTDAYPWMTGAAIGKSLSPTSAV